MKDLATALGLVFVLEGCLWALFPDEMRRAATRIGTLPAQSLRLGGLAFAAAGVFVVWLIRR